LGRIPDDKQPELPFNVYKSDNRRYSDDIRKVEKPHERKNKGRPEELRAPASANIYNNINISVSNHQPAPPPVAKEEVPSPTVGRIFRRWVLGMVGAALNQSIEAWLGKLLMVLLVAAGLYFHSSVAGSRSHVEPGSWTTISIPDK
jgi:hypothetical protein